jgi:hypothetical protein
MLFVDAGRQVAVALVHHFLDVRTYLLVVPGDVCAFRVVDEAVHIFCAIVVNACQVSAPLVTVVAVGFEAALVAKVVAALS